jgi:hypothetical protein
MPIPPPRRPNWFVRTLHGHPYLVLVVVLVVIAGAATAGGLLGTSGGGTAHAIAETTSSPGDSGGIPSTLPTPTATDTSNFPSTVPSESPSPSPSPSPSSSLATAGIGEPLDATLTGGGDVTLTVNSVESHTVAGDQYGDGPKNGEFAVCNVTIKVTAGSYDYDEFDWSFQTPDGNTYSTSDGNSFDADYDPTLDSGTLPAGGLKRGNLVFDVPQVHGGKVIIDADDGTELGYWTVP